MSNFLNFINYLRLIYDDLFLPIKEKVKTFVEVGVNHGGSILMWRDYFKNSKVLGLDNNLPFCEKNLGDKNLDRIELINIDQSNPEMLESFSNQYNEIDVILDDGSHDVEHQQLTFGKLFDLIKPQGFYIIEDLGSSYFTLGTNLYGYTQTQTKINNNTIKFLNQRPFSSLWISEENLIEINNSVDSVTIFDTYNKDLPYSTNFTCENNYPIRSITSVIKKK